MSHRFQKHYTREEARALLPQVRQWLDRLLELRSAMERDDQRLTSLMAAGLDSGGELVNNSVGRLVEIKCQLQEFQQREIFIKDLRRGLVDFPALVGGKEVFLCWEKDEEDIEFWHDIDAGFADREPI
jgi:hypothetical protein